MTPKLLLALLCVANCAGADLQLQVVQGAGVNSRIGSPGQSFVLRVADPAGKPVAGSTVIFSAPAEGPSLDFGEGPILQAVTDASGTVATPLARPVGGAGPVRVEVLAQKNGKSANAIIDQMNVASATGGTAGDFEIVRIPVPQANRSGAKQLLLFRVTDIGGVPVVGAHVSLVFSAPGSKQSVPDPQADSIADGIVEFSLDPKLLKGLNRVQVRVETERVTSTRMIALPEQ